MKQAKKNNSSRQRTILIVDDDLNVLEVLEARLTFAGYKTVKAASAAEALVRLTETSLDLMVSDIKMPGMNGLELFEKVHSTHPDLPVIFLTAYGTIPDAVKAVKAGAYDYLTAWVKAPRLWPNNSLSSSPGGVAPQSTTIKGPLPRGL